MFSYIKSKFKNKKELKCALVIPPLLEPINFYPATPILTGQLVNNGFNAQNLDLNIRFFRTILTKTYIEKTKDLLDKKRIEYSYDDFELIKNNIENALAVYKKNGMDVNSIDIIEKTLKFISLPYGKFNLDKLNSFEHCFNNLSYNYQSIKEICFDKENNIFINFFENEIKKIKKQKINFIGISVPFPGTIIPAFTLARLLKEKTNAHITLGGNFIKSENVLNHPEILDMFCDSVLVSDGEESIVELVKELETSNNLENVSGLIYKQNNKVLYNETKPVTKLDNLKQQSFNGINLDDYLIETPDISLMISKGCYWGKCTFCALGAKYERYCIKKPCNVIDEIRTIKEKHNANVFRFQDDALHPNYLNSLADEILKENLKIYYSIFGRFEKEFTRELLEKLYQSGLRGIYWGLESGSQSILDKMNKGIKLENVASILKNTYEIGIQNMAGIIVNFPTETQEEYNETIEFLKTVKDYVTISPGNFVVMQNSYIEKNSEKYGIKILQHKEFDYCPEWQDTNITEEIKKQRWAHFCECVKTNEYNIDNNKHI